MTANRALRVAATGARVLTGAVVAAGCVLGVLAGVAAPWPVVEHAPARVSVAPVPGNSVLVCNGSFRALGRDTSQADLMVAAGAPSAVFGASGGSIEFAALKMPGLVDGGWARSLTGVVEDRKAPLIGAVESFSLSTDDLAGLSGAACRPPQMQTWLVGGDASTGATDVIVLSNASDVPSTVTMTVYGLNRGTSTSVVPAMTQIAVPLASVAPDEASPVVEVTAEGAPVRASLQSSFLRVLRPVGIDIQDGRPEPQRSSSFTGVQVAKAVNDGDSGTVLRMLSPKGDGQVVIRVHPEGTGAPSEYSVNLTGGVPSEISLAGIAPGFYDIEVTAEQPIVAAVKQVKSVGTSADFSWMTPAPEISSDLMFAVPADADARLHLSNGTDEPVVVVLRDGDAESRVEVPASGSTSVSLRGGATPVLSPEGPVHAAVTLTKGDGSADIAGWPLWPDAQSPQPLTVYP